MKIRFRLSNNWIMKRQVQFTVPRSASASATPSPLQRANKRDGFKFDKGYYHALIKIRKLVSRLWRALVSAEGLRAPFTFEHYQDLLASLLPLSFNYLNYILCKITLWYLISIKRRVDKSERTKNEEERSGADVEWGGCKKFKFNSLKRLCQISFGRVEEAEEATLEVVRE